MGLLRPGMVPSGLSWPLSGMKTTLSGLAWAFMPELGRLSSEVGPSDMKWALSNLILGLSTPIFFFFANLDLFQKIAGHYRRNFSVCYGVPWTTRTFGLLEKIHANFNVIYP